MSDISNDKLSALLSDPEGLKAISNIARSVLGSSQNTPQNTEPSNNTPTLPPMAESQVPPVPKAPVQNKFPNQFDDRVNLLRSIKPYLAKERQSRVDSLVRAISIAKLINTYNENPDIFKF